MTTDHHPITPPDELVWKWHLEWWQLKVKYIGINEYMATQAARWGADQELNECCKWLPKLPPWSADDLRKHRRPRPPSLKEQALKELDKWREVIGVPQLDTIRRALEQLDD